MGTRRVRFNYWLIDLLPRRVIYWCGMRLWVAGTTGEYSDTIAPELTIDESIRRWNART